MAAPRPLFDEPIVRAALLNALRKLNPRHLARNPVMFIVFVGSVLSTLVLVRNIAAGSAGNGMTLQVVLWLWFTILFANFAEAMAEGRGKAQADTLRSARGSGMARRLSDPRDHLVFDTIPAPQLRKGDYVYCAAGDTIPGDGEVTEGVASVDESAITGESAPVIRESGGDRSAVTGGTRVLSDWIVVRVTANPGETFIDRMIALVEGAQRQKTPNEIALTILLAGMTLVFLFAVVTLQPFAIYSGAPVAIPVLVALLVCLIPTTIGGLLSAIGIAGMDRLVQYNVLAMSGRAVEAAGDVNTLLIDKTGTVTLGNRQAVEFIPVAGVTVGRAGRAGVAGFGPRRNARGAQHCRAGRARARPHRSNARADATFVKFSAVTRMSGLDTAGLAVRKGAGDSVAKWVRDMGGSPPADLNAIVERIARKGQHPPRGRREARHGARARAGRHPSQGHRQAGNARAV